MVVFVVRILLVVVAVTGRESFVGVSATTTSGGIMLFGIEPNADEKEDEELPQEVEEEEDIIAGCVGTEVSFRVLRVLALCGCGSVPPPPHWAS